MRLTNLLDLFEESKDSSAALNKSFSESTQMKVFQEFSHLNFHSPLLKAFNLKQQQDFLEVEMVFIISGLRTVASVAAVFTKFL